MRLVKVLILVSIGVSSCDDQHENQLNRVLIESVESMQLFNNHIYLLTKERSYELRFQVQRLRNDDQQKDSYSKLSYIYDRYLYVDSVCNQELARLDTLKSDLLKEYQIKQTILNTSVFPQTIDFRQLTQNQLNKEVSDFFLDEEKKGEKEYLNLKRFRNLLIDCLGSYDRNGKTFHIRSRSMNQFTTKNELLLLVEQMVDSSAANLKEDRQVLIDVYMGLSYPETIDDLTWAQVYFDNSSLLSALTMITKLQNDVLNAKYLASSQILAIGCMASYSFNEVIPIAVGPLVANTVDTIELKVTMGAFDTYNTPVVKLENRSGSIYYPGDGTGRVRLKLTKGIHQIRGTISVQNKSGVYKTEEWGCQIDVTD